MPIDETTGTQALRANVAADSGIVSVQAGLRLWCPVHDDVQHAARSLSVVGSTRVGDDLNVLDGRGGHVLEDHAGVLREHGIGLAIHIHLEVRLAVHGDVVLSVNRHHGHFTQHVEHGVGLRVLIFAHVVRHLVRFHLHQRLLCHHLDGSQGLVVVLQQNGAEVECRLSVKRQADGAHPFSYAADGHGEAALAADLLADVSVEVRH